MCICKEYPVYKVGDEVLIEGRVWVIAEFGTDAEGWACARLEWKDVPQEMQQNYEVPASMIIRDFSKLKRFAKAA